MTISSDVDKKRIKDALEEISNSLTRISAERDLIKDIKEKLHEDFEIDKKLINKMAKVHHNQSFSKEIAVQEEFELLYQNVLGVQDNV